MRACIHVYCFSVRGKIRHCERQVLLFAGIAHTKNLAKLCSGLNKPKKQTVLPQIAVKQLLLPLPIGKLRGLGGDLGMRVQEQLSIQTVGALSLVSLSYPTHPVLPVDLLSSYFTH